MKFFEPLTEEHFREVCRPGQGHNTCRYLAFRHPEGFLCAKHTTLAPALDARVEAQSITARGDNCPGRTPQAMVARKEKE